MSEGAETPQALARKVVEADRGAVARALNLVDDRRPAARARALELLDALAGQSRGRRIGITGAPGAGKSTLLDALATTLGRRGERVAVLAVDPSSKRTGGALLGDRFRLGASAREAGVFFRSLAAREELGGLSEVTGASLDVLAAAFDRVFIETVGVGQSEASVADFVETLVFVAQPAAGDLIQFMKAGILEWPDVFFVNKSDLGEHAQRTATELRAGIALGRSDVAPDRAEASPQRDPSATPRRVVLSGSARDGVGIDALVEALDAHHAALASSGQGLPRRAAGRLARIESALLRRYGRFGFERITAERPLPELVAARDAERPGASIERLIDAIGAGFEARFDARIDARVDARSDRSEP